MNVAELRAALEGAPDGAIVMAMEETNISSVKSAELEPVSTDEGGNPTSTGATLWLRTEAY